MLYKVVQKETRYGSNWAIFEETSKEYQQKYKQGVKFRDDNPKLFPRYLKDSKLIALPDTLGFMLFEEFSQATRFIYENFLFQDRLEIIKVLPLDKPINRFEEGALIITGCGDTIQDLTVAELILKEQTLCGNFFTIGNTYLGLSTRPFVTSYKLVVLE